MLCCEECPVTDVHSVLRCVSIMQIFSYCKVTDFAVNKYLHIVASGWIFINCFFCYAKPSNLIVG